MTTVTNLQLNDFRNHTSLVLDNLPQGFVALVGANGSGKTNVLEALSLLTPGRGLRHAKTTDCIRHGQTHWTVHADINSWTGPITLGAQADMSGDKRKLRLNGQDVKTQMDVAAYISAIWITPQMDGLFQDAGGERRRFFDRLVFAFDASHAGRITRYDRALTERSHVLKMANADPLWLDALEKTLAETAVSIAAARLHCAANLQPDLSDMAQIAPAFPSCALQITGDAETMLDGGNSALNTEDYLRQLYRTARSDDALHGGSKVGVNRTNIMLHYLAKNAPASLCSTGEQKALLTALLLAHAKRFQTERGMAPLILFDEPTAHFDANRRAALFDILASFKTQIWLTGNDADLMPRTSYRHAIADMVA